MVRLKKKIVVFIILLISIIVVLTGVFLGYSYYLYNKMNKVEVDSNSILTNRYTDKKEEEESVRNIALFGID